MNDPAMARQSTETRTVVNGVEYTVRSFFSEDACETAAQKLLRLIRECVAVEINHTEGAVLRSN